MVALLLLAVSVVFIVAVIVVVVVSVRCRFTTIATTFGILDGMLLMENILLNEHKTIMCRMFICCI